MRDREVETDRDSSRVRVRTRANGIFREVDREKARERET